MNRALDGAKRKGKLAYQEGMPRCSCPYPDYRKNDNKLTFSRAFIRAWLSGWDEAEKAHEGQERQRRKDETK